MFGKPLADRQSAAHTSPHGDCYRHCMNGLELERQHRSGKITAWKFYQATTVWTYLVRRWNDVSGTEGSGCGRTRFVLGHHFSDTVSIQKQMPLSGLGMGRLLLVDGGLRTLLEFLAVPDHTFAGEARKLEILGEFERIGGASIFAQAAEHAAAQVVGKIGELFAARLFIALAGNHDQVFWTSQGAQIAGNAQRFAGVGVDVQPRRAAVALG